MQKLVLSAVAANGLSQSRNHPGCHQWHRMRCAKWSPSVGSSKPKCFGKFVRSDREESRKNANTMPQRSGKLVKRMYARLASTFFTSGMGTCSLGLTWHLALRALTCSRCLAPTSAEFIICKSSEGPPCTRCSPIVTVVTIGILARLTTSHPLKALANTHAPVSTMRFCFQSSCMAALRYGGGLNAVKVFCFQLQGSEVTRQSVVTRFGPPAPMNHVKYLRAGPAEMPFHTW